MRKNCRLVAYVGNETYLLGYKLTRFEAKKQKEILIKNNGIDPSTLFIEEYTKRDYQEIFANAWRVKVVFVKAQHDYLAGKSNETRIVRREQSLIYGQGLNKTEAKFLYELACKVYKPEMVVIESYSNQKIELHYDCNQDYANDIELSGKGLKSKQLDNLSFTVLGHGRDKDSKWEMGQIDFTSYVLKSKTTGESIELPCINPYQASCGLTTLPKEKRVKQDDGRSVEYLKSARYELTFSQFSELVKSLMIESNFVGIYRYLKNRLYLRGNDKSSLDNMVYCLSNKDISSSSYRVAPHNLVKKLIERAKVA